jgi:pimeloyl-ACP methyl ester carboxylesterase
MTDVLSQPLESPPATDAAWASGMPHVEGVTHRLVDIGDARLHVAEAGQGEPMVMLHGWPQHWYLWRHVIPQLAPHYRLICVDHRGFGWSDAPPGKYSKEQLATDLLALLDALGLDRVKLVAHDWGGLVGFLACMRAPERFERYMALNMIHPWIRPTFRLIRGLWRVPHQPLLSTPWLGVRLLRHVPQAPRLMLWGGTVDRTIWTRAELDAFTSRLQIPERAKATEQLYRTWVREEFVPMLRGRYRTTRQRVPTLMVFGREDPAIRPHSLRWFEEHADDMALEIVPGASHFIVDERPDLVTDRILRFFGGEPNWSIALGPSVTPPDRGRHMTDTTPEPKETS